MTSREIDKRTPVIVGVGQVAKRWDGVDPREAPSPASLRLEAAQIALSDTEADLRFRDLIDLVMVVRTNLDSIEGAPQPFGRCANPPGTLARDLGIAGSRNLYSVVGGDQPQSLVNEAAEEIFAGRACAALLCGSEAIAAMKLAFRRKIQLDWSESAAGAFEDRGLGDPLLSSYERANGLGMPTQTYPIFEHALRRRLGLDRESYRDLISELWESFSQVAENNPYAQFPQARSREFLAAETPENYLVADPYLKWHVAQDAVNQGAALVLTSLGVAIEAGIAMDRLVFLHGYSAIKDRFVTERTDLSRSAAMEVALETALRSASKTVAEISHFDLYSCFPCAVLLAAEKLGIDWRTTPCTLTGGLPFFGGAGNNYSMHAIAEMVDRLRARPEKFGLVLANGGFLSKESAGVYSTVPVHDWQPVSSREGQDQVDSQFAPSLLTQPTEATIESYTIVYDKGRRPTRGYVLADAPEGRILARVQSGHVATLASLGAEDPLGKRISVQCEGGVNYLEPSNKLGLPGTSGGLPIRQFQFVRVNRDGHVLEVTLDRPERGNALHAPAHFELHEIWDSYSQDPELWVAILTGSGEAVFCSGNDLKVTATGGDMRLPASGFAGICNRFDRTKPIIAAVNGAAMGGGLEIVLACDLALADERARFALPEVKVGLFAAAGGVHRLTRQIGRKSAMELILTGRQFDAEEAASLGVVNATSTAGAVLQAARDMARQILQASPLAIQATREALNILDTSERLDDALAANGKIFSKLMKSDDFREGVTAFAEKRSPCWKGR